MNRNLHSPTKLTEFARDFDAEPETFLTKFVNKITNAYNSGYNTVNVVPQQNVVNISGSASNTPPSVSRSGSDHCVMSVQHSPTIESTNQTLIVDVNESVIGDQKSTSPTPTTSDSISIEDSGEKVTFIDIQKPVSHFITLKNFSLMNFHSMCRKNEPLPVFCIASAI